MGSRKATMLSRGEEDVSRRPEPGSGIRLKSHLHFLNTPTQYPPEGEMTTPISSTIYCFTSHGCTILAHGKLGIQ